MLNKDHAPAALSDDSTESDIVGFVELIAEHQVKGWACNRHGTPERMSITVELNGSVVGSAIADQFRPDLCSAGYGDGNSEFQVNFSKQLLPSDLPFLAVYAADASGHEPLKLLVDSNHSMADQASNPSVPIADDTQHPVFILGPARSGTSALTLALLKSGRYEGFGEGHLLPMAHDLLRVVDTFYAHRATQEYNGTLFRSVAQASFERMIRRGFIQLSRSAFPTGYWIDKTPSEAMVLAAPLMQDLWPNARFIFMKRRVIEYVLSRRRRFPEETLSNHIDEWIAILTAWRQVRVSLGHFAMEVDQQEMARESDRTAEVIAHFLDMPISYRDNFYLALKNDRPEQTADKPGEVITLQSLGLSSSEKSKLIRDAGPIMEAFGYGFEKYHLNGA